MQGGVQRKQELRVAGERAPCLSRSGDASVWPVSGVTESHFRVAVESWKETLPTAEKEPWGSLQTVGKLAGRSPSRGRPSVVRFGQGQEAGRMGTDVKARNASCDPSAPGAWRPWAPGAPAGGGAYMPSSRGLGNKRKIRAPASSEVWVTGHPPTHASFLPLFAPEHPPLGRGRVPGNSPTACCRGNF